MTKNIETTETGWNFDNSYVRLPEPFYTRIEPTPVQAPELITFNEALASELGLDADALNSEEGAAIFAGNRIPEGAVPIAQAYAGHQFGNLTMLGDGRAVLLGEQITPSGKRIDIQLKGAGRTPYSRSGDGRAALGPMLREYIISEAMHALGIPTTRSLAVVATGERIRREESLPGAVLTRTADSHLRFGTFQFAAGIRNTELLKQLADYAIERHYPDLEEDGNRYLAFFREVLKRHAKLVASHQLVGFIHGVMNTDNMTISGETIDYGPCAFMNTYDPATVFSSIDVQGRYSYGNQPLITEWNLARFAESLVPLLHNELEQAVELAQDALSAFRPLYHEHWLNGMRAKLGLFSEEAEDEALIEELFRLMHKFRADYTNTFRSLTLGTPVEELSGKQEFAAWEKRLKERKSKQEESDEASERLMRSHNPAVIPRNHRVEEALKAAEGQGDYSVMEQLITVLSNPYAYVSEQEAYTAPPPPSAIPYRTFCGT